tara:strand:+ start:159 stop:593 length:435 start_codon:yes stop_codon:yes gene_type:complete
MRLKYLGKNSKLKDAVNTANQILENPEFYSRIREKVDFDNTILSAIEVAKRIENFNTSVEIKTWWNPFGSANAKTGNSNAISINTAKLKRTKKSIVNTLIHEYIHAVDYGNDGKLEFTHVDNENNGEEDNTAPWAIGEIAKNMV